jgi:hypothetical protein
MLVVACVAAAGLLLSGCVLGSDPGDVVSSWQASASGKPMFYYFGTPN